MDAKSFYIIAIGASAGGLRAFADFFSTVPKTPDVAFIIVPHLKRDYKSRLSSILSRFTSLKTNLVRGGEKVEPNNIYVIPENKKMTINDGILELIERPTEEVKNVAIDTFLISLARDAKNNAVAVILSGTGADGLNGLKAIEKEGGVAIVQEPKTAQFEALPNNMILKDHPFKVLPPEDMFIHIQDYILTRQESRTNEYNRIK